MILGLDVGLRNTGWSHMDKGRDWQWLSGGVLETKSEYASGKVYKNVDTIRCVNHLLMQLDVVIKMIDPKVIVAEMPSGGGKSNSAVQGMAIGLTVTTAIAWHFDLPLVIVQPDASKKHCCGTGAASKEQMSSYVDALFPEMTDPWRSDRAQSGYNGKFEHVADSVCAVLTAQNDPAVLMALSMRPKPTKPKKKKSKSKKAKARIKNKKGKRKSRRTK